MSKKGSVQAIVFILILVTLAAILLNTFSPLIDSVRDDALATSPVDSILGRIILIGLKPIIWIGWIIMSIVIIWFTVQSGAGGSV